MGIRIMALVCNFITAESEVTSRTTSRSSSSNRRRQGGRRSSSSTPNELGGCQNYGPFLDSIIIRRLIFRVPKKGS